ncbi:MAG: NADH-quinone oxidoreductase subunit A [Actinomycetes bacterium]|jgi:NADH-quinone oxidoreductase subunit A|nr:NADH-quinone oxidoreductase subunit A [Actinomycetes bacterium]
MRDQIIIAAFLILGAAFALFGLSMSWLLSPTRPTHGKGITYESGVDPIGLPWIRFRPGYFIYAILYVVFDIETVFLYPWAVSLGAQGTGWFILIEMVLFVVILLGGLFYAWKEGSLKWH